MGLRTGCLIALAAMVFTGCATQTKHPTEELTKAQTLIDQAEKAGAQRYAGAELNLARTKLKLAEEAEQKGKHDVARERATEAAADAELANALSTSADAQRAALEVNNSTQSLREEAHRDTASNLNP